MGWATMPDTVTETAFERQIKEGKAYQISEEFLVQVGTLQWLYIQMPENKDVVLEGRNISATAGPVKYKVYPGATLVGPLGTQIIPERLNNVKDGSAQTTIHRIPQSSIDVTGITPSDKQLVVAGQNAGNRGVGASLSQLFFKVYPRNTVVAVSLENAAVAGSLDAIVELKYIWAEDVE